MIFALPLSATYMLIAWFVLTRFVFPLPATTPFSGRDFIHNEIGKLGVMSPRRKKSHVRVRQCSPIVDDEEGAFIRG